nr:GNAT family N-acetyltransferase [Flexivirga aerilata]
MAPAVFRLYDEVFGDAESFESWREQMFDRHRARDGFRLATATADTALAGFAWGYVGQRGQFWSDLVERTLPPEATSGWIGDHFEFVELAVDPGHRGGGLGRRLHDALLDGLTGRALLGTTSDPADPAVRLYRSAGWRTLGLLDPARQVMGRELP